MNNCPRCDSNMVWQSDWTCEDANECNCGEGLHSLWTCSNCDLDVEIRTDCKGEQEEDNGKY